MTRRPGMCWWMVGLVPPTPSPPAAGAMLVDGEARGPGPAGPARGARRRHSGAGLTPRQCCAAVPVHTRRIRGYTGTQ